MLCGIESRPVRRIMPQHRQPQQERIDLHQLDAQPHTLNRSARFHDDRDQELAAESVRKCVQQLFMNSAKAAVAHHQNMITRTRLCCHFCDDIVDSIQH